MMDQPEEERLLGIPAGYRPGLGRDYPNPRRSHLYTLGENIMDFEEPMCRYGWNRDGGRAYSIWRGQIGEDGICKLCMKRAKAGLDGVPPAGGYECSCTEAGGWCERHGDR